MLLRSGHQGLGLVLAYRPKGQCYGGMESGWPCTVYLGLLMVSVPDLPFHRSIDHILMPRYYSECPVRIRPLRN